MFENSSTLRKAAVLGAGLAVTGLAVGLSQTTSMAATPLPEHLASSASPTSYTTPGSYTYTVPAGVTSLQVAAAGAAGTAARNPNSLPGGSGTLVQGSMPVTPGQSVTVLVGGQNGTGGWGTGGNGRQGDNGGYHGGDGGSASAVVANGPQLVAGAGGGTGGRSAHEIGTDDVEPGGAGGGSATSLNGQPGAGQFSWRSRGGQGGYESGGNGAHGNNAPPKPLGDFGGGGGGGGAGWNGGRGGGGGNGEATDVIGGGGGGAGSSYTASDVSGATQQFGSNAGNGYVTIVPVQSTGTASMQAADPRVSAFGV